MSAAETLRRLVVEEGTELMSDPGRLRALLADELPDEDESAKLIVAAAEAGVPDDLAALSKPPAAGWDEAAAARLTATGIAAGDAHWAVRVWAFGLGVDQTPPGPRPEDPSVRFTPADQHEPPNLGAPQPDVQQPEVPPPGAPSRIRQHRVLIAAGAAAVVVTVLILLAVAGGPDTPSTGAAEPPTSTAGTTGSTASGGDTTPSTGTGTSTSALPPLSEGFATGFNVAGAPPDPDTGPPPPDSGHWGDCTPVKVVETEIEAAECTAPDSDHTIRVERYGSPDDARAEFDSFDPPEQTRTTASPPPFPCVESSYRDFPNDGRAVYWAGVPYLVWFDSDDPAWLGPWMYAADLNCGIS